MEYLEVARQEAVMVQAIGVWTPAVQAETTVLAAAVKVGNRGPAQLLLRNKDEEMIDSIPDMEVAEIPSMSTLVSASASASAFLWFRR